MKNSIKKYIISAGILSAIIFFQNNLYAQKVVEEEFKVSGNCFMCKERIEEALDKDGIRLATWDVKTKMLKVAYRPDKISLIKIKALLAEAGHDSEVIKAPSNVYEGLPYCCGYRDRDHSGNKIDQ